MNETERKACELLETSRTTKANEGAFYGFFNNPPKHHSRAYCGVLHYKGECLDNVFLTPATAQEIACLTGTTAILRG